jgi:hypothetical protein
VQVLRRCCIQESQIAQERQERIHGISFFESGLLYLVEENFMQLFINDEAVDVQFESEKTLLDVYHSIEVEAARHMRYILECRVEDREVSRDFLEQTSLDSVKSMHFWIGDSLAVLLRTARTMDRYLDQIGSALFYSEEIRSQDIEELKNGISTLKEFVETAASMLQIELNSFTVPMPDGTMSAPIASALVSIEREVENLRPGEAAFDELLHCLRIFKAFTGRLVVRLHAASLTGDDISAGLDRFEQALPDLAQSIVRINELYQSGKDDQALVLLDGVMQDLDALMPYLFAALERLSDEERQEIVGERSLEETASALLALLSDLSSALEENDIVAAGDILEYELAGQIQSLAPVLQWLKKFLPEDVIEKQS